MHADRPARFAPQPYSPPPPDFRSETQRVRDALAECSEVLLQPPHSTPAAWASLAFHLTENDELTPEWRERVFGPIVAEAIREGNLRLATSVLIAWSDVPQGDAESVFQAILASEPRRYWRDLLEALIAALNAGKNPLESEAARTRRTAVERVRAGESQRAVALDLGVPRSTLQRWLNRA